MTYFQAVTNSDGIFKGFISGETTDEIKNSRANKYGYVFKALNMGGNHYVTIEGKKTPQRQRRIRESEQINKVRINQIKNI